MFVNGLGVLLSGVEFSRGVTLNAGDDPAEDPPEGGGG